MEIVDPYQRYEQRIAALYAQASSVSWARAFEAAPPENCTPRELATSILEAVPCTAWAEIYKPMGSNWAWRPHHRPASIHTGEVALGQKIIERALAARIDTWTFQMPTMSGVTGPHTHNRRSIDLVHYVGDESYRFIELETTSNDPAHAAFELLFYGIAYIRTRQQLERPVDEIHRVMTARRIDLVVLAPRAWYAYKVRHAELTVPYALGRLTNVLNETLAIVRNDLNLRGFDELTFGFQIFDDEADLLRNVEAGHEAGREYARGIE